MTPQRLRLGLALVAYIGAIVAANVMTTHLGLVGVGFGLLVTAGTFAAGFALFARDFVHRFGGPWWALGAIAVGGAISYLMADPFIATASVVAFTGAELVDLAVFASVRDRIGFAGAVLVSNVVAAPVDTLLFLHIAGFGVTWQAVTGQLIGKLVWATAVPLALYLTGERALLRQSVDPAGA